MGVGVKLSKTQQGVIDKMGKGWELGQSMGITPNAWLQKGGLGKGGKTQVVSLATVFALFDKGCIKKASEKYPKIRYKLTQSVRNRR